MTLVSDIITRAYRETNVVSKGAVPTATEITEALPLLNSIILSTIGYEVGDGFTDVNIGGTYDQSSVIDPFVPLNARLVLNLTAATTIYLDPFPEEGMRFALVDVAGNLATYNLTIDTGQRLIEGASSLVLNTNSIDRQYLYRADTGNWVKITSLVTSDNMPLPVEYDDYFIIMLASRLNPRHGTELSASSAAHLKRMRSAMNARYSVTTEVEADVPARLFSSSVNSTATDFDAGIP